MNQTRRDVMRHGGTVALLMAAGLLRPGDVRAADWNQAAFEIKKLEDLVTLLGGEPATADGANPSTLPDQTPLSLCFLTMAWTVLLW